MFWGDKVTKLILIRHGQTVWNKLGRYQGQADVELSDAGKKQAELLGENFPYDNVAAVYSSNLKRAVETAQAVADKFNLSVNPCQEFREINFGEWEGLTYEEIHGKWPKEHEMLFKSPDKLVCPGGEGFKDVQERAVERMQEIIRENDGKQVVIAAHGGVIRTMLCHALGLSLQNMWHIKQDNTAINVVSAYNEGMVVELLNSTQHLAGMTNNFCDNFSAASVKGNEKC